MKGRVHGFTIGVNNTNSQTENSTVTCGFETP
jgi:hypothetical protein